MTSIINNIGNSLPAKLLRSAIKFRNACRKINFSYCKVHPVLKLNLACLSHVNICWSCLHHPRWYVLYIHGSLNTCHLHVEQLIQNRIVQQCLATVWPRIANTSVPIPRENMIVRNSPYLQEVQLSQWKLSLELAII